MTYTKQLGIKTRVKRLKELIDYSFKHGFNPVLIDGWINQFNECNKKIEENKKHSILIAQ